MRYRPTVIGYSSTTTGVPPGLWDEVCAHQYLPLAVPRGPAASREQNCAENYNN